jgi:hypothetical protein
MGAWTARQRLYVEQWNEASGAPAGGDDGRVDEATAPADVSPRPRGESSSEPEGVAEDLDDSAPPRAMTIAGDRLSRAQRAALVPYPENVERPRTRGECAGGHFDTAGDASDGSRGHGSGLGGWGDRGSGWVAPPATALVDSTVSSATCARFFALLRQDFKLGGRHTSM